MSNSDAQHPTADARTFESKTPEPHDAVARSLGLGAPVPAVPEPVEHRGRRRRHHRDRGWHGGRSRKHRGRRPDWDDPAGLERHQRDLEQRAADLAARIDRVRERINELAADKR